MAKYKYFTVFMLMKDSEVWVLVGSMVYLMFLKPNAQPSLLLKLFLSYFPFESASKVNTTDPVLWLFWRMAVVWFEDRVMFRLGSMVERAVFTAVIRLEGVL